jgi:hypothetical protein
VPATVCVCVYVFLPDQYSDFLPWRIWFAKAFGLAGPKSMRLCRVVSAWHHTATLAGHTGRETVAAAAVVVVPTSQRENVCLESQAIGDVVANTHGSGACLRVPSGAWTHGNRRRCEAPTPRHRH